MEARAVVARPGPAALAVGRGAPTLRICPSVHALLPPASRSPCQRGMEPTVFNFSYITHSFGTYAFNQGQPETYRRLGKLVIWHPIKPVFFKCLFDIYLLGMRRDRYPINRSCIEKKIHLLIHVH